MYPRVEYQMSEDDLETLLQSSKPVPCIMVGGYQPPSQQENANRAWADLGKRMHFDSKTVRPIAGKGNRFFSAIPKETEEQRKTREIQEYKKERQGRINKLKLEIDALSTELRILEESK